jgi:multicomponent Na+:H+ antiporter subunit F
LITLYYGFALFLLLNLAAGIWRVITGPSAADRMLAAQLFGTTAVALLLLLAQATSDFALLDVALVLAILAAIAAVAFVQHTWTSRKDYGDLD